MIEGERVFLRALEPGDEQACWRWINDPEAIHYLKMPPWPVSLAAERAWIERHSMGGDEKDRIAAICLKKDGRYIGNVGLHGLDWRNGVATLGILIGEKDYWDQGYGEETIRLMLGFAFRSLGLVKVRLSVYAPNKRAFRCYQKCGFEVEGVLKRQHLIDGEYVGEILMAVFRPE